MSRRVVLEQCRDALEVVRVQQRVVEGLKNSYPERYALEVRIAMPAAYLSRLSAAETVLESARQNHAQAVPLAMAVLERLKGREYDVLWRYYILGQTTREISRIRKESHRTVTRAKAQALKILEDVHE